VPGRNVCLDIRVNGLKSRLAAFCLLMVSLSLLPLDAFAQITESLLPYPVTPRTPQEQPSAFAPIGLRVGDFFWFPRAELDEAYNSNIFATSTRPSSDLITALTTGFDLRSNFSSNSLMRTVPPCCKVMPTIRRKTLRTVSSAQTVRST